ncbi:hypothetical protein PVAND_006379 [Polypedilum vanderplanki]|uniref:Ionotropic receptor n=1 Tax=Polypedilum vanderplanki TaxID=319348 RepID=A0A9J6C3G6_POLVA|nr:hypothetical protein PVAND_006379 [Polypedilum vanderplanki]
MIHKLHLTTKGIVDILQTFFGNRSLQYEIIVFDIKSSDNAKLVDYIVKKWQNEDSYASLTVKFTSKIKELKPYSLIIVDSLDDFLDQLFIEKCNWYFDMLNFIYVIEGAIYDEFPLDIKNEASKQLMNSFLIYPPNRNSGLRLIAPTWFKFCDKFAFPVINSFNMKTRKWNKPLVYFDKFKNLNGCSFYAEIPHCELQILRKSQRKDTYCIESQLLKIFGKQFNFKPKFVAERSYLDIYDKDYYQTKRCIIAPFKMEIFKFSIPPAEIYTSYEKLLFPFDFMTWILLLGTFGTAFTAIFIVNHLSRRWQDIVYGEGIRMAAYNVVGTFFGISQSRVPRANFPRMLLILFIGFCMIFRNAYQGVFYEMLTTNMSKPQPKSIQDLVDGEFTLRVRYDIVQTDPILSLISKDGPKPKIQYCLSNTILDNFCKFARDSSLKTAVLLRSEVINNKKIFCQSKILTLDEIPYTSLAGISVNPNHFMLNNFAKVMNRLLEAGIVQNWHENFTQEYKRILKIESTKTAKEKEPQVLTLEGLSFGFVLWLTACGITIIVFIIEILLNYFKEKKDRKNFIKVKNAKVYPLNQNIKKQNCKSKE